MIICSVELSWLPPDASQSDTFKAADAVAKLAGSSEQTGSVILYKFAGAGSGIISPDERRVRGAASTQAAWTDPMGAAIPAPGPFGMAVVPLSSSPLTSALSSQANGSSKVLFSKSGGPRDRIQGLDVWTAMGIGAGVPARAVAGSVKNISKYTIWLGEMGADTSVNPTRYFVKNKIQIAAGRSTNAFAGRDWTVSWVLFGPINSNPPEGYPQIEVGWQVK